MKEVWKDIPGYEGLYQVSNYGSVMSLNYARRGYAKPLTPKRNNSGRLWVELTKDGVKKQMLVHRLVGLVFLPNPNGYPQINHKDENPRNNRADNLEWCTPKYNVNYFLERRDPDWFKCRKATDKYGKRLTLSIYQFSKSGTLIRRWDNSRQITVALGWSDWSISECCRGNRKTAYGYIWRYANDDIR